MHLSGGCEIDGTSGKRRCSIVEITSTEMYKYHD